MKLGIWKPIANFQALLAWSSPFSQATSLDVHANEQSQRIESFRPLCGEGDVTATGRQFARDFETPRTPTRIALLAKENPCRERIDHNSGRRPWPTNLGGFFFQLSFESCSGFLSVTATSSWWKPAHLDAFPLAKATWLSRSGFRRRVAAYGFEGPPAGHALNGALFAWG